MEQKNTISKSHRLSLPALLTLVSAIFAGFLIVGPPVASADPPLYTVHPCNGAGADPGIGFLVRGSSEGFDAQNLCGQPGPGIILEANNGNHSVEDTDEARWSLTTPPGTSLDEVSVNTTFPGEWAKTSLGWQVVVNGPRGLVTPDESRPGAAPLPGLLHYSVGTGSGHFPQGSNEFIVHIVCATTERCAKSPDIRVDQSEITAVLQDESTPVKKAYFGTLLEGGEQHGTLEVTVTAADSGSGIVGSRLFIGGSEFSSKLAPDNNGKCHEPFEFLEPCASEATFTYQIDTTQLTDGIHPVQLRVSDAAGNILLPSADVQVNVHNAPRNTANPSISGTPRAGTALTANPGGWGGTPVFSYQWLRCPAAATSHTQCAPITGATATRYTPVKADLGMREMVEVTAAANPTAVAKTAAFSPASDVVADVQAAPGNPGPGNSSPNNPRPNPSPSNPPQTSLAKHPRKKTATSLAKFRFTSDQASAHFECKLDKRAFEPCRSPFKLRARPGPHVFRVRAVDGAGLADPTPALFSWKVSRQ